VRPSKNNRKGHLNICTTSAAHAGKKRTVIPSVKSNLAWVTKRRERDSPKQSLRIKDMGYRELTTRIPLDIMDWRKSFHMRFMGLKWFEQLEVMGDGRFQKEAPISPKREHKILHHAMWGSEIIEWGNCENISNKERSPGKKIAGKGEDIITQK